MVQVELSAVPHIGQNKRTKIRDVVSNTRAPVPEKTNSYHLHDVAELLHPEHRLEDVSNLA